MADLDDVDGIRVAGPAVIDRKRNVNTLDSWNSG